MTCEKTLAWYDLVPVLSWVALRGQCSMCGASISVQYPLVEALTGVLFATVATALVPLYISTPLMLVGITVLSLVIVSLFVAIAVYDIYHTIIPDPWVYTFVFLALFSQFLMPGLALPDILPIVLSGPLVAAPLYLLWRFSDGMAMGFGDVKFALGMGWLLGLGAGYIALFFAFIIGALFSIPLLMMSSVWWRDTVRFFTPKSASQGTPMGYTMKSEVPFGPFLIAGTIAVWLLSMYGVHLIIFQ